MHGRAPRCMEATWCMEVLPGAWKSHLVYGSHLVHGRGPQAHGSMEEPADHGSKEKAPGHGSMEDPPGAWESHQVHRSHYHDYSTIGPHTKGIERSGIITDWALIDTDNVMNVTNCNIHYNSQLDRQQVPRLKVWGLALTSDRALFDIYVDKFLQRPPGQRYRVRIIFNFLCFKICHNAKVSSK